MLGLVASSERESRKFIKLLDESERIKIKNRTFYKGRIGKRRCVLVISGSGKIRSSSATQLLIDNFDAGFLINFGSCGSLEKRLKPGDIILASKIIEHDFIEIFPDTKPRPVISPPDDVVDRFSDFVDPKGITIEGTMVSGDEDIVSSRRRGELASLYNAIAVDQESAGFSLTCKMNGKGFAVLKVVTDMANEGTKDEFESNLDKSSGKLCRLVIEILSSDQIVIS